VSGEQLNVAFGVVLRRLREARGLSQEELAHDAQTGQPYISLLEAGKHSPSLATMDLVADALGVALVDLIEAVEKERRSR